MEIDAPKPGRRQKDILMIDLATRIGKQLRRAREESGLTQEEVGTRLGIGRAGYANIENGRSLLQMDHLMKLPEILEKPVTYFLEVESDLSVDEGELLQVYRSIPDAIGRSMVVDVAKTILRRFREL